jgi:hypothetical protein
LVLFAIYIPAGLLIKPKNLPPGVDCTFRKIVLKYPVCIFGEDEWAASRRDEPTMPRYSKKQDPIDRCSSSPATKEKMPPRKIISSFPNSTHVD